MTILPSFLITGILAVVIGAFFILWSLAFVQGRGTGFFLPILIIGLLALSVLGSIAHDRVHSDSGAKR